MTLAKQKTRLFAKGGYFSPGHGTPIATSRTILQSIINYLNRRTRVNIQIIK
jgi:hypothetical protein